MKIITPQNENYAATIVKVNATHKLSGLDNLVGISVYGLQALVPKSIEVGSLGVLLPAGSQLSEDMVKINNLYRHSDLNSDKTQQGYIEDNRRVKAIRLKQNSSSALFLNLSSLNWTGIDTSKLKEGDTFDELNGKEICRKFELKTKSVGKSTIVSKKKPRVDEKFFPEHMSTANYWRNKKLIKGNDSIVVLQKLHGTSIRIGNALVNRKLNLYERILKKLDIGIQTTEYDIIAGSRKVIKDPKNENSNHFYDTDIWTNEAAKYKDLIPKGFMIYGELVGYTPNGGPIQKGYTYNEASGNMSLYVYRVSIINPQGIEVDLSWDSVKEFCISNGIKYTPEIWRGKHRNINIDDFMDRRYFDDGIKGTLQLSNKDTVDEGVIVRKEGIKPVLLKAKSQKFLEYESSMLDEGILDLEESQK